jgi:hypothetical protein
MARPARAFGTPHAARSDGGADMLDTFCCRRQGRLPPNAA